MLQNDYTAPFQLGQPTSFALAQKLGEHPARALQPRLLHQLGLRVDRHRAEDGHGLPSRARRGPPPALRLARARVPRRQHRRHLARRHGEEPRDLRRGHAERRHHPPHLGPGHDLHARRARDAAPSSPTTCSVTARPTAAARSPRSSSSRSPARPAPSCRRRATSSGCARSATRHGILLVFDEVITGSAASARPFAVDAFGVTPGPHHPGEGADQRRDPDGRGRRRRPVHATITDAAPEDAIEFFHGYTYSAHPAACAAGLATLQIYEDEGLFERAADLSGVFPRRGLVAARPAGRARHPRARPARRRRGASATASRACAAPSCRRRCSGTAAT